LNRLLEGIEPDEIYNLGAQSYVKVSFEGPEYTAEVDAVGTLRFLDAIKDVGLKKRDSIKPPRASFMDWCKRFLKLRRLFLPALAICSGRALCLLDRCELS